MLGIIIQARTGSTRLPQKVIKKIVNKTVLEHVIERAKRVKNIDEIILATTKKKEDDKLEKIAKRLGVSIFRGSKNDVLDRYYQVAKLFKISSIIRITADCPLLDPRVAEEVINFYSQGNCDYVSNTHPPTFPNGMDIEIFNFKSLKKSWQEAKLKSEREHVTPYIYKNPNLFKIGNIAYGNNDFSYLRLTLDEKEDLFLIREIYKELYDKNPFFGLEDILELFKRKPELIKINQHIKRNEGYLKSLQQDKIYEKRRRSI
jgi:spore coat polysaccharide biosynthesis protein SpsF